MGKNKNRGEKDHHPRGHARGSTAPEASELAKSSVQEQVQISTEQVSRKRQKKFGHN